MRVVGLGFVLLIAGVSPLRGAEPAGDPQRGKVVYQRYCVSCHGKLGDGNGEFAKSIDPKPRDYRQGIFKWRSTPSGSLPLPSDLERTLENGVYGTYMPPWYAIGDRSRRDVIAYVQTFSSRWTTEQPAPPISIPPETPDTPESVARGRSIYMEAGCAACHGESGQGDGPSAKDLKNTWGHPSVPTDLTEGHIKCGGKPEDFYRALMTGLNGTPMPAFGDSLSAEQAWDLVHYVQSLPAHHPKRFTTWVEFVEHSWSVVTAGE